MEQSKDRKGVKPMKVAFFNPQGNFDPDDSYLTMHPDFGGQLIYVKEVAMRLSKMGVEVDIITRRVIDKRWPEFANKIDYYPNIEGVRIVRIDFGGEKFLPKEELWPHLYEFAKNTKEFYEREGVFPEYVTTHYGDGGIAGAMFSSMTGIPFSFTAHSLGAQKMERLIEEGHTFSEIDEKYHFTVRINAERVAMKYSTCNITNSKLERYEQYSHHLYKGWVDPYDDEKFRVVPPGVNFDIFHFEEDPKDKLIEKRISHILEKDNLPFIVASSRIDPKKNHIALIRAYISSEKLQSLSNIIIVTRGIEDPYKDLSSLDEKARFVLEELIGLIKRYGLEKRVYFVNIEGQKELGAFYRILAKRDSIFMLPTLHEPFGLAVIEAMASGLPVVATKYGGPSEILFENNTRYGILIDVSNVEDIKRGLIELLSDKNLYKILKERGIKRVREKYNWDNTAKGYLDIIKHKRDWQKPKIPDYFIKGKGILKL